MISIIQTLAQGTYHRRWKAWHSRRSNETVVVIYFVFVYNECSDKILHINVHYMIRAIFDSSLKRVRHSAIAILEYRNKIDYMIRITRFQAVIRKHDTMHRSFIESYLVYASWNYHVTSHSNLCKYLKVMLYVVLHLKMKGQGG